MDNYNDNYHDNYYMDDYENVNTNLVTNFRKTELEKYHKAIKLYGSDNLYITDDATDVYGNPLPHLFALRCKEPQNLSRFWRIFESLEDDETSMENENEYHVSIKLRNEDHAAYNLNTKAVSEEDAINKAKLFIAACGYWSTKMSIGDRINQMEVVTLKKL